MPPTDCRFFSPKLIYPVESETDELTRAESERSDLLVESIVVDVHLQESERNLLVWLVTANHLDAVDRVERVFVIEQCPVTHIDQRLHGTHAQHAVDIVRRRVDPQRHKLRLQLGRRLAVQHQSADRVAVVVVDGAMP